MTEEKLTPANRNRIFLDLKNSLKAGLGFLGAVLLITVIAHVIFALFGLNTNANWLRRMLITFGACLFIFCLMALTYYNHYLDLVNGKKISLHISRYKIVRTKNVYYLVTNMPSFNRIPIDEDLLPFINRTQALNVELAKKSQLILFISNGTDNYVDKTTALVTRPLLSLSPKRTLASNYFKQTHTNNSGASA
jgi:preprotein translocase subunit SecG